MIKIGNNWGEKISNNWGENSSSTITHVHILSEREYEKLRARFLVILLLFCENICKWKRCIKIYVILFKY